MLVPDIMPRTSCRLEKGSDFFSCSTVLVFLFVMLAPDRAQSQPFAQPLPIMTDPAAAINDPAGKLIRAAANNDFAYRRLAQMCDTFGPRLSGSSNLEAAIDWALDEMKKDGLENVHGEDVLVPHWVR